TTNHEKIIGVCGCVAQEEGAKLLKRFPEIDLIFGPDQIYRLPELLELVESTNRPAVATELINTAEDYHFLDAVPATRLHGPTAFITIMKGCNSHCSYCIVPKVRGTEVYREARDIIREIEAMVERGCREVTLLGQNVNSYRDPKAETSFANLIRLIADNTNINRIRFTSPHPKDVKEDLVEEYAHNAKLCPHIHLPLQSGADSVLKRMRRAYNTGIYREKVAKLRNARVDLAMTSDIIVGFPSETAEEFEQTLSFVEEMQFDNIYAFKYSPRPDTEAFALEDDVPLNVKDERLSRLLTLQSKIAKARNEAHLGTMQEVLVEGPDKMASGRWMGKSGGNKVVNFTGNAILRGDIVNVEITKANANSLEGRVGVHG
ncbi:MAG: tRNA (N6-isopentenyl adenosine(37)-C2)-methylthiotransferase MiaB, partial [Deltaproteobacteria bacterium]|nr:tRNA (N6-isopentenyl adenosine(37)-C2)-methylthiotransferase MiaB [Deltaproteobacteria bacterium]